MKGENVTSTIEGDKLICKTSHFTEYVVVDVSGAASDSGANPVNNPGDNSATNKGDNPTGTTGVNNKILLGITLTLLSLF